jgi:inhibitor of cysteine peptidase
MQTLNRLGIAGTLTALTALAIAGCSHDAEAARSVRLTAEDSGRIIESTVSDRIVITLESNITTGFSWVMTAEPDAEVLELVDSEYRAPETELVGAGGHEIWTFRATGPGSTAVELRYERPSGETVGEPFGITVDVAPAG